MNTFGSISLLFFIFGPKFSLPVLVKKNMPNLATLNFLSQCQVSIWRVANINMARRWTGIRRTRGRGSEDRRTGNGDLTKAEEVRGTV